MAGRALDEDMAGDGEFLARICDDRFAANAYSMFVNRGWAHRDGSRFFVSWREAGGIVARWRERGESYIDFYMADFAAPDLISRDLQEEVRAFFERSGWHEVSPADEADFFERALARIALLEAMPPARMPEWFAQFDHPSIADPADADLRTRLKRVARTGLLEMREFLSLHRDILPSDDAVEILRRRGLAHLFTARKGLS
jgi:hypothetical protein